MGDHTLILYGADSIDAEAAKELLLERWPNAETSTTLADAAGRDGARTEIWYLGFGNAGLPYCHGIDPTPDACMAMLVWRELNPCRDKQHPGPRIREGRKMRGMTTGDLALKCGVSASAVSHWELQRADPSKANVTAACAALGVCAPWIYGVSDSQKGGWPQTDPPWHVNYIQDAACEKWLLPDSECVWAWLTHDSPAAVLDTIRCTMAQGVDERTQWTGAARTGRAILRARKLWKTEREEQERIRAVALLNKVAATDAEALAALFRHRVPCSDALGDHPTVQVGRQDYNPDKPLEVGMLGIINGLFGARPAGGGYIGADYGLECSACCEVPRDKKCGDLCEACGEPIELGELRGFVLLDDAPVIPPSAPPPPKAEAE